MFIGCLSSTKQQEESSQIASDTVVETKEQRYFSKNVEDELLLEKAMADALEKITASFQGKDWEYMYDFDTTEEGYAPIGVYIKVRKFAEGVYYAVIYTYDQAETLIRLYRIDNNTMQEKVSESFPLLTDPSDTIFDANGDGVKDFALRY